MEEKLKAFVAKILGIPAVKVNDRLKNGEGEWDSFNHLLLISEIEGGMGVIFTTDEIEKIKTFGDLKDIVRSKIK